LSTNGGSGVTIDSTYDVEVRKLKEDTKYYYEFETATDSEVEVYVLREGYRTLAANLSGENE
jgi:hypothetical protein